MILSIKLKNS